MLDQKQQLDNLQDYVKILSNYRPSDQLLELLRSIKFVLLSAPTAAGRNTLIHKLVSNGGYHYVVSDTTRPKRENNGVLEQNGVEYWFKDENEFLAGLKKGEYLEAAIVHEKHAYGVNGREFVKASQAHQTAITDIDIHGCDTVVNYSPTALPIFVLPPKYDVWMYRLDKRGVMPADEKQRRLKSAIEEISLALSRPYFKFVTNIEVEQTNVVIDAVVNGDISALPDQESEKEHAKDLLQELKNNI